MTVKILTCKLCGEEIESRRLWKCSIQVHIMQKHKKIDRLQFTALEMRQKYFTEKTAKVSDKITEAPHYGTTTDW